MFEIKDRSAREGSRREAREKGQVKDGKTNIQHAFVSPSFTSKRDRESVEEQILCRPSARNFRSDGSEMPFPNDSARFACPLTFACRAHLRNESVGQSSSLP